MNLEADELKKPREVPITFCFCPRCGRRMNPDNPIDVLPTEHALLQTKYDQLHSLAVNMAEALKHWKDHHQRDIPITQESTEQSGEDFMNCWFETERALKLAKKQGLIK